jgi:hypothetical protein
LILRRRFSSFRDYLFRARFISFHFLAISARRFFLRFTPRGFAADAATPPMPPRLIVSPLTARRHADVHYAFHCRCLMLRATPLPFDAIDAVAAAFASFLC